MLAISLTTARSRYTYDGAILHADSARGESHNQRNTTGEAATESQLFRPRCFNDIFPLIVEASYQMYQPRVEAEHCSLV